MPSATPILDLPFPLDADARGLYPTTAQDLAERLEELLEPVYGYGNLIGYAAPATGATVVWGANFGTEPGSHLSESGGAITYSGPDRRILVIARATIGVGAAAKTELAIDSRVSTQSGGVGPDGQATHSHEVSMVLMMGPSFSTSVMVSLSCGPTDGFADVEVQVVGL